ncbi:hypothetical protein KIW84_050480 [Lathyrus oleraceus]|uniref:Arabidopsis retrotransposon Orf1 C-terminal domain-containing protein n=1 Tax=Pisum sativum TaxID=3888 RepID=A0A9D4WJH3_PEA|nr:hypothetical protein KIW84_050480 [Pisum sativum]
MPHREVIPRREMNYIGIAFAEGINVENQRSKYHKLLKRDILATQYPDDASLRDLGLSNRGSRTISTAKFRTFNRNYAISQDQLADLFSFPHGDKFACQHPLESEWESNALDFWKPLTGKTTTDWEILKATDIQNLTIRYLHHILAITIFCRENTGNVNSRDLFLIYCVLSKTKVNLTPFLLAHFQSTSVRTGCPICVGGLITSITLALNLSTELATLELLETPFADLDYYRSMRLIKNKPDGKYFLMISNREEYDYTAMRTTLDDVLSELRHQNDANADCDVLLRHIQRQQEEIRVTIDQIRETHLDFVERTKLQMGDLIEQMTRVHLEVACMREYMQHVPNPAFGRRGFA